jgi:hypothetical protein
MYCKTAYAMGNIIAYLSDLFTYLPSGNPPEMPGTN